MNNPSLAVFFADVCGSAALYAKEGDAAAAKAVMSTLTALRCTSEAHGGTVIKLIGDGILCTFPSADQAFHAASLVNTANRGDLLPVKAAFHHGPVLLKDGDVYGDTVNVASRICDQAENGEVLLSEAANAALSPPLSARTRELYRKALKGKTDPISIFGIVWEEDEGVTDLADSAGSEAVEQALLLVFGGHNYSVTQGNPRLVLGRDSECDIVLEDHRVSRQHAVVELKHANFYLQDQSTNGTHILTPDEEVLHLQRKATPLLNTGGISPGRDPRHNDRNVIWFRRGTPGSSI
jgi:adenylate cyclase